MPKDTLVKLVGGPLCGSVVKVHPLSRSVTVEVPIPPTACDPEGEPLSGWGSYKYTELEDDVFVYVGTEHW